MFEKILLGYAGDEAGRDAAVLAAQLAELTDGELTVVFPFHPLFTTVSAEVAEQRVRAELAALLPGSRAIARAGCRWSNAGWPIHALHELAEYEQSELIVFGAAPDRPMRRHLSLMERMVHGAPCAVALAPQGYASGPRGEMRRVGVGFADTDEGRRAISLAGALASANDGTVAVIACSGLGPTLTAYASASPELPKAEAKMHAQAQASAERVSAELLGGVGEIEVRDGDPCRLLVDASKRVDLLILGSRAYGPLRHVLLGSVSACVMRGAYCPVLVSPRGAAVTESAEAHSAGVVAAG